MTEETPPSAPTPKKTYTPEEKAEILRRMRRGTFIMFLCKLLIAALGIGLVFVQTEDVLITGLVAAGVVAYLIYSEIKVWRK